jgi:hypothetical protein
MTARGRTTNIGWRPNVNLEPAMQLDFKIVVRADAGMPDEA